MTKKVITIQSLENLDKVEVFKLMCRMLEIERRRLLNEEWDFTALPVPRQQYPHLLAVRDSLPCDLAHVMEQTGLTSAGASIFVDKMVKAGVFERKDDPADRRHVIISLTRYAKEVINQQEDRINLKMMKYFSGCTAEESKQLEDAARLVCQKICAGVTRKKL